MRSFKNQQETGAKFVTLEPLKKAQYIPFADKKDQQVLDDIRMTPEERFMKMIELIELSLTFSPTRRLKVFTDDRFIELKRKK